MDASDLRDWVALFMMDLDADGQGGTIERIPAGLVADRPANVRQATGNRIWASDQLGDRIRKEITIRFEPGITTSFRLMWNDQFFDIVLVTNIDELDTWLKLTCERLERGQQ